MKASHQQKHQAGRHLVVAQALLRGYDAKVVGRYTLVEINGQHAQVQVAAQGAWQIDPVDKYLRGTVERVVLVDISRDVPDFYILPGDRLREIVRRRHQRYIARIGGIRPRNPESKHSRIDPTDVQRWRNRWSLFD